MLVATCAVAPCVFTTRFEDVFTLPKLIVLWISFAALCWLIALDALAPGGGRGIRIHPVALVDVPIALFMFWNLLAFVLSSDRHQSLVGEQLQHQGVLTLLLYVAFFGFARALIISPQRVAVLFGAITVGATVSAGYAIVQALGLDPIWGAHLPSGRVFSTIGQANALAAYLVLSIPVAVALGLGVGVGRRPVRRMAPLGAAALMVVALFLTVSRGGYVGLAATLPVAGYAWRRTGTRRRRMLGPAVGLVIIVVVLALVPSTRAAATRTWSRVLSLREGSSSDSTSFHLDEWRVAGRIVRSNPVVGTGPETFPDQFPRYSRVVLPADRVSLFDQYRVESPHNVFLAMATGAGIPAVLAYVWWLVAAAVLMARGIRDEGRPLLRLAFVAILAAMVAHVVTDSFTTADVTSSWLFWTLMGVGVGLASGPRVGPAPTLPDPAGAPGVSSDGRTARGPASRRRPPGAALADEEALRGACDPPS